MTGVVVPAGALDNGGGALTQRDRAVLDTLGRVRVATSAQLARLHFTNSSERAVQRCLSRLSRGGYVVRLARRVGGVVPGSAPWTYALGTAGQRLLGVSGPFGGRVRRPLLPSPTTLRHALIVTEVYVTAVEVATANGATLRHFTTEPECWRRLPDGGWLKPDADLALRGPEFEDHYFVEADTGSEGAAALSRKVATYRAHYLTGVEQAERGVYPRVLFIVLDARREAWLWALLDRQPDEARALCATSTVGALATTLGSSESLC